MGKRYDHLYEPETIKVTLEMHVFARSGDFVMAQYNMDPFDTEVFIYNTKTDKCYGRYSSIEDDEELTNDWDQLTGEESDE